jgi:predicted PurR-regulated permease PerM
MTDFGPHPQRALRSPMVSGRNIDGMLAPMAVTVVVIAALYFGREVFVPLALAILLSFVLGPVVLKLRRLNLGRIPAVIVTVLLAFVVIFALGGVIANQATTLAENLTRYQYNIAEKIDALRGMTTEGEGGILQRAANALGNLRNEIVKSPPAPPPATIPSTAPAAPSPPPPKPLLVEVHQPDPGPLQIIQKVVGPLLGPLATSAIVIVFVIFFLSQREDLRDRFIRLAGYRDLRRTTEALDDATRRLSRYLLTQLAINAGFGVVIGFGLWIIGVPNPVLWGVFGMLLRFVPYIGAILAALFPAALAIAVAPGWSMLVWTVLLFAVIEPFTGSVVEPWLYGRHTGISAVAIIVAAAFWTWLWGPVGLLLSTPLTVCLVVVGRHVDQLKFLDILLGDRPALAPEEGFYQRVLAGDPDEAALQAEALLKSRPLSAYYDEVAMKGLALAQLDMNRGGLDHDRRVQIKEAVDAVIDNLSDYPDSVPPPQGGKVPEQGAAAPSDEPRVSPAWRDNAVLCVAGRGSLDEATAAMLAQLLNKHGIGASITPAAAASVANLHRLDTAGVKLAFLCYLEPGGYSNARYLVRRLRRRLPHAKIVIGFWNLAGGDEVREEARAATGADVVVTSLREAVEHALVLAKATPAGANAPGRSAPVAVVSGGG